MTEKEYNEAKGIRRSDLWRMEDSPEKFKWYLDHPMEQTPAMAFGTACHKMILEPDTFGDEFITAPKVDRRTNDGKATWMAFMEAAQGKTLITDEDALTMSDMEAVLERCPLAYKLLRGKGETEAPFFWVDPETGEPCKIKVDRLVKFNRRWYVVDYKTTQCADTFKFNSDMWKLGYYMQAAMYTEGVMRAKKLKKRPGFLFVAQEKKAPYSINVIEAGEDIIHAGDAKFHQLLGKYHQCKEMDLWPGYLVGNVPNDAFVPNWMQAAMEDEFE